MRPIHDPTHADDQNKAYPDSPMSDGEESEWDEIDPDDPRWEAFIADDDERNPEPEYGDFWSKD